MASRNNKRKIHPDRNVLNLYAVVLRGRSPLLKKEEEWFRRIWESFPNVKFPNFNEAELELL